MGRRGVAPEHSNDDLLVAIERLLVPKRGERAGLSKIEIMKRTGWGDKKVLRLLHLLNDEGKLVVGRELRQSFGGMQSIVVYSVKR